MALEVQEIRERIGEYNEEAILWDGLDEAVIGISSDGRVVYDVDKVIVELQKQGMSEEEAIEWYDFNIASLYYGEYTPIHIYTL